MAKYIIKRLLMLIPVLIGVTLFIYVILSISSGNPARLILGVDATAEQIAAKELELGLDKPMLIRYVNYMFDVLKGDFGRSWYNNYEVLPEFLGRLPNTLTLGLLAMAFATIVGIPLGVIAAVKQYSVLDYTTLVFAMFFSAMPGFWFGLLMQILLCLNLGLLPATGNDTIVNFLLPAFTLGAAQLAQQVRLTRTSILDVIKQDYVRTAKSKGCSSVRTVVVHVLRNGLLPVVTNMGAGFALMLGGAVVTESVFAIPGIGTLLTNAVKLRDIPVVMGVILILATAIGIINLIVDLVYMLIDPRVKLS